MNKNTTECLLAPKREKGEPEISGTTILCPNPRDLQRFTRLYKEYIAQQFFLYNGKLLQVHGKQCDFYICGPAVGAPMAVLSLEKLIALGCQKVIVFGSCGALSDSLSIADIFLPVSGVSEEGTSKHYPLQTEPSSSPTLVTALLEDLAQQGLPARTGKIWTTDAPYRETREKVEHYRACQIDAVDMEFTALISVAAFRGIDLSAVMVVSDSLAGDQWASGFTSKAFKKQCNVVCDTIFNNCYGGQL